LILDSGAVQEQAERHLPVERKRRFVNRRQRRFPRALQRVSNRGGHRPGDGEFMFETDLPLGRMDVDIHLFRRDGEEQHRRRVSAAFGERRVSLPDSPVDRGGFDRAAVDEGPLFPTGVAREPRGGGETGDGDAGFGVIDRPEVVDEGAAEEFPQPRFRSRRGGGVERRPPVNPQFEAHFGAGKGQGDDHLFDVVRLGGGGFEKFLPGRSVEEEVAHLHDGADRTARGRRFEQSAPFDSDPGPFEHLRGAGEDGEPADRGDRGERFAAEAERGDPVDVLRGEDLAGAVRFNAEQNVVGIHARTVVGDADQPRAGPFDFNADPGGAGVDGVFHQFLDHGRGPFDHLAGRNPVAELFIHHFDFAHGAGSSWLPPGACQSERGTAMRSGGATVRVCFRLRFARA